jgi:hypothetical protein
MVSSLCIIYDFGRGVAVATTAELLSREREGNPIESNQTQKSGGERKRTDDFSTGSPSCVASSANTV